MPTPKSKWQMTVAAASFTGGLPPGTGAEADRGIAVFDPAAGLGVFYALQCFLINNGISTDLNTVYTAAAYYPPNGGYATGTANTPMLWQSIVNPISGSIYHLVLTDSGASYLAGGTIAIEKDFDNGLINFITPAGTIAVPFDTVPMVAPGAGSWSDSPLESGFWHSLFWGGVANPVAETNNWVNWSLFSNASLMDGAALSSADPGIWDPQLAIFGPQIANSDLQHALFYTTEFQWSSPANPFSAQASEYRRWITNTHTKSIDVAAWAAHTAAVGVWQPTGLPMAIQLRRSDDDGHTWVDTTVLSGSDPLGSATVQEFGGAITVLFADTGTTTIYQTVSMDAGITWSTPIPISITGANPRLVISHEGAFFYFSLDGGGNINLQRSFDLGATLFDGVPIVVAAGVPTQGFGAVQAADRSFLVAYVDGTGAWVTRISKDFGLTWNNA